MLVNVLQLAGFLAYNAIWPAVITYFVTWLTYPPAAPYAAAAVFVWDFVTTLRRVQLVRYSDDDDTPGGGPRAEGGSA